MLLVSRFRWCHLDAGANDPLQSSLAPSSKPPPPFSTVVSTLSRLRTATNALALLRWLSWTEWET